MREATGGRIAGLVNNAGIAVPGPLEYLPMDEFRRQIEVNLTGQVAVTQAFLPMLRPTRGRIVNIGSIGGRVALPLLGPYAASKHAMEGLTDSLRRELRPAGIEVSIIRPGPIATEIWERGNNKADELLERMPEAAAALRAGDRRRARRCAGAHEGGDPATGGRRGRRARAHLRQAADALSGRSAARSCWPCSRPSCPTACFDRLIERMGRSDQRG